MPRRLLLSILLLLPGLWLEAQRIDTQLLCEWKRPARAAKSTMLRRVVIPLTDHIELLTFPDAKSAAVARAQLLASPDISAVQYNWYVSPRTRPNDPDYPRQDNMARAGFETAWDLTTGGVTPDGRQIVTAILDAGFDVTHEDLSGNLWRNEGEIPDDGLDNDGNGFVDDIHGWNFIGDSPDYPVITHGTQVAGLIGAVGNNRLGVTGTNWQSNLMLFAINTVADIIASYQYIADQRQLYNESLGERGAFVVATNASFGIEGGTCADFPVWGAMYESLGAVGVLTAASVANVSRDVDVTGDMPTDCPSDFLLGVTNVDEDDRRFPSAGYGRVSVDLGAPGEGSYTTRPENAYGSFGSTSAAAPYVTGAISLLYATPCALLQELIVQDPAAAALLIRQSILSSVRPQAGLEAITSSGGVLDVSLAQEQLLSQCTSIVDTSPDPSVYPNPTTGQFTLRIPDPVVSEGAVVEIYDALGRRVSTEDSAVQSGGVASIPLDIGGLPAGLYFVRVKGLGKEVVLPVFLR